MPGLRPCTSISACHAGQAATLLTEAAPVRARHRSTTSSPAPGQAFAGWTCPSRVWSSSKASTPCQPASGADVGPFAGSCCSMRLPQGAEPQGSERVLQLTGSHPRWLSAQCCWLQPCCRPVSCCTVCASPPAFYPPTAYGSQHLHGQERIVPLARLIVAHSHEHHPSTCRDLALGETLGPAVSCSAGALTCLMIPTQLKVQPNSANPA